MKRNIPVYFDHAVIVSPVEAISEANGLGRLKVGVFTRYGNRNGSYIKDNVAEMLIASATRGNTPVVGFFDPESQSWAGHTGPALANGYGYVEGFEGWQLFTDSDGVQREYAVFSVVLFTNYFNEANFVVGQNQSMELDINSIEGDWADINGVEYFVYTKAEIMGLCIIGSHEPCFSASAFFEKMDTQYQNQYDKFSSLLADLKAKVEEAEKNPEGGEQTMDDNNLQNPEMNEPTPAPEFELEAPAAQEPEAPAEEPAAEEPAAEPEGEPAAEPEGEPEGGEPEPAADPEPAVDFEAKAAELQAALDEVTANFEAAQARIAELETANAELEAVRTENETLKASIATYEVERTNIENDKKNKLIEKYEKLIDEEEIESVRTQINDFSYEQLESKLAICFANKQMAGSDDDKVPLPEPAVNQFALLMEKYRKN